MRANVIISGLLLAAALGACGSDSTPLVPPELDLTQRAYIVSRDSDELAVIDLKTMEIVGRTHTGGLSSHMAELSKGFDKVYVSSPETNEVIVLDAKTLEQKTRIAVGMHPTHMSLSRDGSIMAVMLEWEGAVSIIDVGHDVEKKRIPGFVTPHFIHRFNRPTLRWPSRPEGSEAPRAAVPKAPQVVDWRRRGPIWWLRI